MSFRGISPQEFPRCRSWGRSFLEWLCFPGEGQYSFVFGTTVFITGVFCAAFLSGAGMKMVSMRSGGADENASPSARLVKEASASSENPDSESSSDTGGPLEPESGDSLSEEDFQDSSLDELDKVSYTIDEHDNLFTALQCFGVSKGKILSWSKLAEQKYNLARLRPGQSLSLYKDGSGRFVRFELNINKSERLVIEREDSDEGDFVVYIETFDKAELESSEASPFDLPRPVWVDPESGYHYYRGTVESSFYKSAMEAGMSPSKIMSVIHVFGQINFERQIKQGTEFSIVVAPGDLVGEEGPLLAGRFEIGDDTYWSFRFEDNGKVSYYDEQGKATKRNGLLCPVKYSRISSGYTHRRLHPILKVYRPHLGIDYAAPAGRPIKAATDGRVVYVGRKGGFGRTVVVKHDSGFKTLYGHMSRYAGGIKRGKRVSRGQVVGYVGESGLATGPHLDYRVYKNGKPVNPLRVTGIPQPPVSDTKGFKNYMKKMKLELKKELPLGPARPWPPEAKTEQVAKNRH
ncbi:MAG: peptidoglycan DD-metalloendopeptidase family protein [bacterium]